jgi:uncharacterized phage protein (TIGR02220 family)
MAEGKKGFLMYADWYHTIKKLPDDIAGKLFKHSLMYVNDMDPTTDDLLVEVTFEPMKQQFKRDLIAWEQKIEGYSKAGKASAEAKRLAKEQLQQGSTTLNDVEKKKEEKKEVKATPAHEIDFDKLLDYINKSFNREFKLINDATRKKFKARLKEGYTNADIKNCIDTLVKTHHKENGYQYCTPEFISRPDTMTKYSTKTSAPSSTPQNNLTLGRHDN